uniref:Uncharacterized protein n=1 Tax=viral metagenome TaxID=1070528 RepID=A0A6H1ZIP4_9ZZZZ
MTTILGEHVSSFRPVKIHKPILPKERFAIRYRIHPKTRKITPEELQELKSKYEEELNDPTKA